MIFSYQSIKHRGICFIIKTRSKAEWATSDSAAIGSQRGPREQTAYCSRYVTAQLGPSVSTEQLMLCTADRGKTTERGRKKKVGKEREVDRNEEWSNDPADRTPSGPIQLSCRGVTNSEPCSQPSCKLLPTWGEEREPAETLTLHSPFRC